MQTETISLILWEYLLVHFVKRCLLTVLQTIWQAHVYSYCWIFKMGTVDCHLHVLIWNGVLDRPAYAWQSRISEDSLETCTLFLSDIWPSSLKRNNSHWTAWDVHSKKQNDTGNWAALRIFYKGKPDCFNSLWRFVCFWIMFGVSFQCSKLIYALQSEITFNYEWLIAQQLNVLILLLSFCSWHLVEPGCKFEIHMQFLKSSETDSQ